MKKIVFTNVSDKKRDKLNAGSKARNDVEKILQMEGFEVKEIYHPYSFWKYSGIRYQFEKIKWMFTDEWFGFWNKIPSKSVLFFQWPFKGDEKYSRMATMLKPLKRYKTICLIHDIESIRYENEFSKKEKQELLSYKFDYVIVHNRKMQQLLVNNGIYAEKILVLEIFDYLDQNNETIKQRKYSNDIVIAGNLAKTKAEYVYQLPANGVSYHLYGEGYQKQNREDIIYYGAYSSEEIIGELEGSFGLVWDGGKIDTCDGVGKYLRYNNPHKISLYIAAGFPVIIWKEAALAEFVKDNGLGFCVNNLQEISNRLSLMTEEEYELMRKNVKCMAKKLKRGYHLISVLEKINI